MVRSVLRLPAVRSIHFFNSFVYILIRYKGFKKMSGSFHVGFSIVASQAFLCPFGSTSLSPITAYLEQALRDHRTRFAGSLTLLTMVTGTAVGVLVRGSVVTVQVEKAVVRVLVVVAADVEHDAAGVVVAIVGLSLNTHRATGAMAPIQVQG